MGTKTQSSSSGNQATSFQFNPASMKLYQQYLAGIGPQVLNFASQPYTNPQYLLEQSMGQNMANTLGQRGVANVMNNMSSMGFGNMPGFQQSLLANAGRQTMGLQSQAWQNAFRNAGARQQFAMGLGASFQPLMTGTNSNFANQQTTQTSGLGTWLPQVAGAALGAFTGGLGGGLGSMMGGGGGGSYNPFGSANYGNQSLGLGNVSSSQIGNWNTVGNALNYANQYTPPPVLQLPQNP